jgi:hypothetical protein
MPVPYRFLNKELQTVPIINVCNEDEYGGYVDVFFDRNWKEIGWQPTHPEIDDETSQHFSKSMLKNGGDISKMRQDRPMLKCERQLSATA